MKLYLRGHNDRYCVEQLQLSLFPDRPLEPVEAPFSGDGAVSALSRGKTWLTVSTAVTLDGVTHRCRRRMRADRETTRGRRRLLQQTYYLAALPFLPEPPPWGALAGVRPTKLSTAMLLAGQTRLDAQKTMERDLFVTPARAALALECSQATLETARLLGREDVSVYIGIPFCPTRCAYCSFVSRGIGSRTEMMEPYLDALLRELEITGKLMGIFHRKVRTLYIGGGTPTTLSPDQLRRLLESIRAHLDLTDCLEFTVEAGRPDTIDPARLAVLRAYGADRISVNPQSMVDSVLAASGRPHRGADILRAVAQAREAGFQLINMDLIAGLPTDTPAGFQSSLDQVMALMPANITVHTLALKKGADLFSQDRPRPDAQAVGQMVRHAGQTLSQLGYRPYYLYRQKYMSGSFENVGWTLPGGVCRYNICMMEELHPIVSLGGGAMSKVPLPGGALKRFPNPKYPEQYLSSLDKVLRQKEELFSCMEGGL